MLPAFRYRILWPHPSSKSNPITIALRRQLRLERFASVGIKISDNDARAFLKNRSTVERPIPLAPPVTIATFLSKRFLSELFLSEAMAHLPLCVVQASIILVNCQ